MRPIYFLRSIFRSSFTVRKVSFSELRVRIDIFVLKINSIAVCLQACVQQFFANTNTAGDGFLDILRFS